MQIPKWGHTPSMAGLRCILLFALGLAMTGGCSGRATTTVTGKVTVDTAPVEKGIIHFQAADGAGPTAEAEISDGVYTADVPPGNKKVSIQAFKKVGERHVGRHEGQMADETVQTLPKRFSDPNATELRGDITGSTTLDFALELRANEKNLPVKPAGRSK